MRGFLPRVLALFVSLTAAFPPPVFGLRAAQPEHPLQRAGLEEVLRAQAVPKLLGDAVDLTSRPVIDAKGVIQSILPNAGTVLITADAGKGTRFMQTGGSTLKVIAPVGGLPAGVRTKLAAEELGWPVISVVGYRKEDVMAAYNPHTRRGIIYVEAENPTGGTGYAVHHAAAVPGLRHSDKLAVVTMGDQPLYDRMVLETVEQAARTTGADLVIASALFVDPRGKGRIVRDRETGRILGILEEKDIQQGTVLGGYSKEELLAIREGNVSIYAMPARRLFDLLSQTRNDNAQEQYYLTDIVKMVLDQGGRVEAVQIEPAKAPDLTTADDLAMVEKFLASQPPEAPPKAGLEEVRPLPSARPAVSPMRFLVDTSGGESRVLHFAQWAVLLDRAGLPIRFSGVATTDELVRAQAALPDEASRQMLTDHIQVYDPADESGVSYGTALALAQMTVFEEPTSPQEIRRLTLREYNPLWVQWFLGELDRLGIQKLFEPALRNRIEAYLTAA